MVGLTSIRDLNFPFSFPFYAFVCVCCVVSSLILPPCVLTAEASSSTTSSSSALLPDGVLEVVDRCSHAAPYFSDPRVLSSQEVWQSYVPAAPPSVTSSSSSSSAATTTEEEGGTSEEWLPLRFVVSTLDLTEPGQSCQAVGQEVPDFLLSFPVNSSSSSNGGSDDHLVRCSAEDSLLTDEKRNVLVAHVLPRALLWLSQRIAVMSVQGNLSVLQQGSCGAYTIPSSFQVSGVPDADVLVLVSAVPPPASGSEEWVRGSICQFDQNGRPTVLVLNVAPEVISVVAVDSNDEGVSPSSAAAASASSSSGAFCSPELGTYSDVALYSLSRSVSHALVHGLGFSYSYLTSRLSQNVSMAVSERRGKAVRLVTSTLASRAATTHFGSCVEEEDNHSTTIVPWVAGVELEDQGMAVNHNGTYSSSHWEARNHGHDLMSAQSTIWVVRNATVASRCLTEPAAVYRSRRFTNVTLSFLEDFGFYRRMNQSLVEDTLFGKGLGCAFLSETCNLTRSNALWSSTYCKERGGGGEEEMSMLGRWCAADRRAVANCPTTQYAEPVPWPFRYFVEDATQGGLWDLADYCPLPSPVHWCSSDATTTSTLTELSQLLSISGVPDSRCLTFLDLAVTPTTGGGSPLWDGAVCANLRCVRDDPTAVDLRVQLQLRTSSGGNEWSTCDDAGSTTSSSSSSQTFVTVRWNETATVMVACPSVWEVCDSVSVVVLETTTTTSTTATETTTTSSTTDGSITSTTDQPSTTSTTTGASTTTMAPNDTNSTTTVPPNETFAPATTTTTSVPFTTSAPQDNSGGRGQRPLRPEAACNHTCVVLIAVIGGLLVFAILVYMVVQCGKAKRSPPPPPPPHPTPPRAGPPFFRPIMYEPTPDFEMMTFNEYQQHRHNGHQQNQPQQEEEVYQERRTESRSPQQPGGRQGLQQYDSRYEAQTRFNAPSAARWAGGGGGTTPHGNSYDRHL